MSNQITVTVQELGQSAGGKQKVKAGGKWYFMGGGNRDTGPLPPPAIGQTVTIMPGSFSVNTNEGPKSFATIESWTPAGQQNQQQHPQRPQNPPQQAVQRAAPDTHFAAFIGQGFISNVVGQAIASGAIKSPGQILGWFNAAKLALEGKPSGEPFSDNVPFGREPGSDDGFHDPKDSLGSFSDKRNW